MMTTEQRKAIADETLRQLGGSGRLSAMIGAHQFSFDENGTLHFWFKGSRKVNNISIELNGKDLYDIKIFKFSPSKGTNPVIHEFNDVYNDQLKSTIEKATGLYLSL